MSATLPLPYRVVSFHEGYANKDLMRRAAELGFNGAQFQLEGSTIQQVEAFAARDAREGYSALCRELGLQLSVWVHELSDIAGPDEPGYLGPVTLDNEPLWDMLARRYEWILGEALPQLDALVLTVVETQINITDKQLLPRLVGIVRDACQRHGKELWMRTFVWHPEELEGVLDCVQALPDDVIVMTKCVPQDWQMRGVHNSVIGAVGEHQQVIEYDIAGEYFLANKVANCMPELLKEQFDYQVGHNISGICVRVDRHEAEVLHEPSEVNLWALGMFANGTTRSLEDVWQAWTRARFGSAAEAVTRALHPTQTVITECLNVGSFSFGDTRRFPPDLDANAFYTNWANWRWDEAYLPEYEKARTGDPDYTAEIRQQKHTAMELAELCLEELEQAHDSLDPADYEILQTRLLSNKIHLEFRTPMMLAYLSYQRLLHTDDPAERATLAGNIRTQLEQVRQVATTDFPAPRELEHRGRTWQVGSPLGLKTHYMQKWLQRAEELLCTQNV